MRRCLVSLAVVAALPVALVIGSLAPTVSTAKAVSAARASAPPNVVIIMTDDQRWDTVTPRFMPQLTAIASQNPSIAYTNAFVPNSLCCPSRSSTLTGDYSHTTGVYGNVGQWGGFGSFTAAPDGHSTSSINDTKTMAVDMHDAGYRTALVGKYLNGYPSHHYDYVPPGWDRWFAVGTGVYYNYYAATATGRSWRYGSAPQDYITRVLTDKAKGFVRTLSGQPFFLYYATTAPHGPSIPDPRDVGRFDVSGYRQPPSFGKPEAGAPRYIKDIAWDAAKVEKINEVHAAQLDTNFGVDRSIGQIWDVLPSNTLVLFMSDNGYAWGEHTWTNKQVPYAESLRVPMMLIGKDLEEPAPERERSLPPDVPVRQELRLSAGPQRRCPSDAGTIGGGVGGPPGRGVGHGDVLQEGLRLGTLGRRAEARRAHLLWRPLERLVVRALQRVRGARGRGSLRRAGGPLGDDQPRGDRSHRRSRGRRAGHDAAPGGGALPGRRWHLPGRLALLDLDVEFAPSLREEVALR